MQRGEGVWGEVAIPPTRGVDLGSRLVAAVTDNDPSTEAPRYSCYLPHHGLTFGRGDKRVVVHICFLCNWLTVLPDGAAPQARAVIYDGPGKDALFEELHGRLLAAGVTVPPDIAEMLDAGEH